MRGMKQIDLKINNMAHAYISQCNLKNNFKREMDSDRPRDHNSAYLDVSEFILKEHSPMYRTKQHDAPQVKNRVPQFTPKLTPDVAPIDIDTDELKMSPFFGSAAKLNNHNPPQMFLCEQDFQLESSRKSAARGRRRRRTRQRSNTFYLLNPPEAELDKIIEETDKDYAERDYSDSEQSDSEKSNLQSDEMILGKKQAKPVECTSKDIEFQKQSTNPSVMEDNAFSSILKLFHSNAKNQLIEKIHKINEEKSCQSSFEEKLEKIKDALSRYLFDYEMTTIEAVWKEFQGSCSKILYEIVASIQALFRRKIGVLNFQNRRVKLLRYLQKKKQRVWRKKVSYDCRKRVADGRLRIKGKFVTKEQVCSQLGIESLECLTSADLKALMDPKGDDLDCSDAKDFIERD